MARSGASSTTTGSRLAIVRFWYWSLQLGEPQDGVPGAGAEVGPERRGTGEGAAEVRQGLRREGARQDSQLVAAQVDRHVSPLAVQPAVPLEGGEPQERAAHVDPLAVPGGGGARLLPRGPKRPAA